MRGVLLVLGAGVLVVLFLAVAWWWQPFLAHLSQETGTSNAASRAYDFWSGFGSDLGEIAIVGGLVTLVRHHNCHERGCWRLGKHTTPEGFKLCKQHVAKPKDELHLHTIHSDHGAS